MAAVLRTDRAQPGQGVTPWRHSALGQDTRNVRVMVIDDSLTVRTVFSRMIDREMDLAVVAQASTAEQGLMMLRSTPVDVVLLDLEMPGMGGIEALPQILSTAKNAQVLVVSSLTTDGAEATVAALRMGAADTMLKPRPGGFTEEYRANLLGKIRALGSRRPLRSKSPCRHWRAHGGSHRNVPGLSLSALRPAVSTRSTFSCASYPPVSIFRS